MCKSGDTAYLDANTRTAAALPEGNEIVNDILKGVRKIMSLNAKLKHSDWPLTISSKISDCPKKLYNLLRGDKQLRH